MALSVAALLPACGESTSESGRSTAATTATPPQRPPLGSGTEELDAGTHVLDLVARDHTGSGPADLPKIEITLPKGWSNFDGWAVGKRKGKPEQTTFVLFAHVDEVYPTPCKWKGKPMVVPGPTVEGLASALAKQPLRSATAPTDIELAGFRGTYLKLSVPSDIDFDDCDEGTFESWTMNGWASDRYQQSPGQVDRLWILDVNGERLVIDASYLPDATARDRAELDEVVRSIRFLDGSG